MKRRLIRNLLMAGLATGFLSDANARVWRVNPADGIQADFKQISTAAASASVLAGDTLYVEGSATHQGYVELKKRLVIIGNGYFLSGTGANTGLQANPNSAYLGGFYLDSLASGTVLIGMQGYVYLDSRADDIVITRCNVSLTAYNTGATYKAANCRFTKNYLSIGSSPHLDNAEITNNIIYNTCMLNSSGNNNLLFRNNVVINTSTNIVSAYVSNNIITSSLTVTNCTVKYNISTGNFLPAGNNNVNNVAISSVFVNTGSSDGMYKLKAGSPAIAAGEPINGIIPDCGAFGTDDPYRLSGIPPVPSIYALTVPASTPSSSTSMTVTISTRSNN